MKLREFLLKSYGVLSGKRLAAPFGTFENVRESRELLFAAMRPYRKWSFPNWLTARDC